MDENVKRLPVATEELYALLCDEGVVNYDAYVGALGCDGLLVVDGHLDLGALAAWINKRMGATEGSE